MNPSSASSTGPWASSVRDMKRVAILAAASEVFGEHGLQGATMRQIVDFGLAQFRCWTEEAFHSAFRKLLTLEQYRSEKMRALYQQYLVSGPLGYVTDLFAAWKLEDAQGKAIAFYAPMFLFYSMADGAKDKSAAASNLEEHLNRLCLEWGVDG